MTASTREFFVHETDANMLFCVFAAWPGKVFYCVNGDLDGNLDPKWTTGLIPIAGDHHLIREHVEFRIPYSETWGDNS